MKQITQKDCKKHAILIAILLYSACFAAFTGTATYKMITCGSDDNETITTINNMTTTIKPSDTSNSPWIIFLTFISALAAGIHAFAAAKAASDDTLFRVFTPATPLDSDSDSSNNNQPKDIIQIAMI